MLLNILVVIFNKCIAPSVKKLFNLYSTDYFIIYEEIGHRKNNSKY